MGFIAKSQLAARPRGREGSVWIVPADLHGPDPAGCGVARSAPWRTKRRFAFLAFLAAPDVLSPHRSLRVLRPRGLTGRRGAQLDPAMPRVHPYRIRPADASQVARPPKKRTGPADPVADMPFDFGPLWLSIKLSAITVADPPARRHARSLGGSRAPAAGCAWRSRPSSRCLSCFRPPCSASTSCSCSARPGRSAASSSP